jgi:hypothetical protein
MIKIVDRALSGLLILGAIGHTLGVIKYYQGQPDPLFWALGGTVLILLVAAINFLRSVRLQDRALALLAAGASGSYVIISICFGYLVDNPLDVRAVTFALVSLGLTFIGLRQAVNAGSAALPSEP